MSGMDLRAVGDPPKFEIPVFFAGRSRVLNAKSVNTTKVEFPLFPLVFRVSEPPLPVSAEKLASNHRWHPEKTRNLPHPETDGVWN
jgi:hypothetical protein